MRTKLNQKQRKILKHKRCHAAEIREIICNGEEVPECGICYAQLTSINKIDLSCEHKNYCLECIDQWYKKSK